MTERSNISTENQPKGAARNPSDTLDKPASETKRNRARAEADKDEDPGFATNGE